MLEHLLGLQRPLPDALVMAELRLNIPSQAGREDWIPVTLSGDPDDFLADPIFFKSNLIFNLVKADGLLYIPADATGLAAGETVRVYLL
jgi:molybdopterin molybdotransferase